MVGTESSQSGAAVSQEKYEFESLRQCEHVKEYYSTPKMLEYFKSIHRSRNVIISANCFKT